MRTCFFIIAYVADRTLNCCAKALGGCDGKSREHFITKGLWKGPLIHVQGMHWCPDESKAVALLNLKVEVRQSDQGAVPLGEVDSLDDGNHSLPFGAASQCFKRI